MGKGGSVYLPSCYTTFEKAYIIHTFLWVATSGKRYSAMEKPRAPADYGLTL
jgi:hypothetical protein